ncbi:MAB_1171c family putative transporter [Streptomyces sp. NPDC058773]|uniref:MAB_1171c family putative transporter n=1 Tax=Streptomyces sp. NPDC058773 TaxID=3346632 RepID=UPI003695004F
MPSWIETAGITALWVVAIVRVPQGIRNREQRPLWFALIMIALAMSMHLTPVTAVLAHMVPGAHWVDLTTHLFSIIDAAAVLWFILHAAERHRPATVVFGAAFAVMTALVLLDMGAPPHTRNQIAPSTATPSVPDSYWWIFFAFHLAADTSCGLVCWSQGRRGAPRLLRYGLRLFGTGFLLASLLWILKLAYLHARSAACASLFSPVTGVEALFLAAGAALPVLTRIRTRRQHQKAFRDLAPLWRDLTAAAPDVIFGPGNRLHSAVTPLQLRLYRRVIEIRDAMIALRSYVTPAALDLAHQHVPRYAASGHSAEAHITACWLTAALHARQGGRTPEPQSANLAGPGAQDLTAEINHLLQVAAAYRSPTVQAYKASLLETA